MNRPANRPHRKGKKAHNVIKGLNKEAALPSTGKNKDKKNKNKKRNGADATPTVATDSTSKQATTSNVKFACGPHHWVDCFTEEDVWNEVEKVAPQLGEIHVRKAARNIFDNRRTPLNGEKMKDKRFEWKTSRGKSVSAGQSTTETATLFGVYDKGNIIITAVGQHDRSTPPLYVYDILYHQSIDEKTPSSKDKYVCKY
eukprot:m.176022 g.176022  ORF g.176022 m.176022 type:complete len:199 (-) comp14094_c0_seq1:27-623(-)